MRLTVTNYNIQHGKVYEEFLRSGNEIIDHRRAAQVAKELGTDILALNEIVSTETPIWSDQPRDIAEALGYKYYVFGKAIDVAKYDGGYGNAIVSRYPIVSHKTVLINVPKEERVVGGRYEQRAILIADIDVNGTVITVIAFHIGLMPDEMELAISALEKIADENQYPIILMGDFNFKPDSKMYASLSKTFSDTAVSLTTAPETFPSDKPNRKIDYIMTRGSFKYISSEITDTQNFDHRPISAVVEIV